MLIPDDQGQILHVGDKIEHAGERYIVEHVVFSSQPEGKYAIELKGIQKKE